MKNKKNIGLPFRGKIGNQTRWILLATISVIGTVAFIAITVLMLFFNRQRYQSESETFSYISRELSNALEDVQTIVRMMAYDNNLTDELLTIQQISVNTPQTDVSLEILKKSIAKYSDGDQYISYVNLWQDKAIGCLDEKLVQFSRYAPVSEMLNYQQRRLLTQYAIENGGFGCWIFLQNDFQGVYYVRLVRTIKDFRFVNLGVIAVRVNLQRLINDLARSDQKYDNKIIMLGKKDNLMLSTHENTEELRNVYRKMASSEKEYSIIVMKDHRYFVVATTIPILSMKCCYMVVYDQPYIMAICAYIICILGVLVVLIASLLISGRMIRLITRHFDTLYHKMNVYSQGNFEPLDVGFDYTNGTDEISQAHNHLDDMALQIRTLINDNYIKQLRIQEAAFKALEQQINPHFLYNTLSSIQWQAVAAGQTNISQMVCSLGNIMRFSLHSADIVTIEDEIAIVKDYMTIQKLRYQERLEWHLLIEPTIQQLKIPKMTIQPLVENAIKHGLEQMPDEVCTIEIHIWEENSNCIVEVRNNGSVFEEQLMDKLRCGQISPRGFGIGMLNIDERIRLLCGSNYGLKIYNENGYAVVRAILSKKIQSTHKGGRACGRLFS